MPSTPLSGVLISWLSVASMRPRRATRGSTAVSRRPPPSARGAERQPSPLARASARAAASRAAKAALAQATSPDASTTAAGPSSAWRRVKASVMARDSAGRRLTAGQAGT